MYINKCTKCGAEFETKNPKRVICPNCLYPDRKTLDSVSSDVNSTENTAVQYPRSYVSPSDNDDMRGYSRPQNNYNRQGNNNYNRPQQGGYNRQRSNSSGYDRNRSNNNNYNRQGGNNYNRPQQGGYSRSSNGFNRNNRPQRPGGNRSQGNRPPQRRMPRANQAKQLLVSKEQLFQIETLYKKMLPLPNPDAHELIGAVIQLEPRKVFFGMNLVRQKMFLPKLPFPKRKLAVSPEQLMAIKSLYEPLLPLPPIGCHKIIAIQLKMDEWRVHVGIGIIRKQMGLDRWNEERTDVPDSLRAKQAENALAKQAKLAEKEAKEKEAVELKKNSEETSQETEEVIANTNPPLIEDIKEQEVTIVEDKPKRGRKKKTEVTTVSQDVQESVDVEEKPKRTRKKKTEDVIEDNTVLIESAEAPIEEKPKRGRKKKVTVEEE